MQSNASQAIAAQPKHMESIAGHSNPMLSNAYVTVQPENRSLTKKSPVIAKKACTKDTTKIGSIDVPTVGTGTISWSSNSCKFD